MVYPLIVGWATLLLAEVTRILGRDRKSGTPETIASVVGFQTSRSEEVLCSLANLAVPVGERLLERGSDQGAIERSQGEYGSAPYRWFVGHPMKDCVETVILSDRSERSDCCFPTDRHLVRRGDSGQTASYLRS